MDNNYFKGSANFYRKALQKDDVDKEATMRTIKAHEYLSTCDDEDIQELFNSSVFNQIVKGYVKKTLDYLETDRQTCNSILKELEYEFDTVLAKEAEEYYYEH